MLPLISSSPFDEYTLPDEDNGNLLDVFAPAATALDAIADKLCQAEYCVSAHAPVIILQWQPALRRMRLWSPKHIA